MPSKYVNEPIRLRKQVARELDRLLGNKKKVRYGQGAYVSVMACLLPETWAKLDEIADDEDTTRAEVVRRLVDRGLRRFTRAGYKESKMSELIRLCLRLGLESYRKNGFWGKLD